VGLQCFDSSSIEGSVLFFIWLCGSNIVCYQVGTSDSLAVEGVLGNIIDVSVPLFDLFIVTH